VSHLEDKVITFVYKACPIGCRPVCTVCGHRKQPIGRDAAAGVAGSLCSRDCPGYPLAPTACDLWPGECRACFEGTCKEEHR
jgi:hypothetical protein